MGDIISTTNGSFDFHPQFSCLSRLAACLFIGFGLGALAETNNPPAVRLASAASTNAELAAQRAELAAERAEAAAKQAEAAARRAEAMAKQAQTQGTAGNHAANLDSSTNVQSRLTTPEDEDLRSVRFMVANKLLDFNDVEREARAWLTKDGHAPPKDLAGMFEVFDGEVFVTVKFGQEIGKRFWYVKFNRALEVEEWGARILKESD